MSRRGVTLIELLIALVISAIAFFALAMPFIAERSFWLSGNRQTEAQRDAQIAMRAIARVARASSSYAIANGGAKITFTVPGSTPCFQGGPAFGSQLQLFTTCGTPPPALLIDGNRSKVTSLVMTAVNTKLVRVQLQVTYQNQKNELLVTNLLLRNAS